MRWRCLVLIPVLLMTSACGARIREGPADRPESGEGAHFLTTGGLTLKWLTLSTNTTIDQDNEVVWSRICSCFLVFGDRRSASEVQETSVWQVTETGDLTGDTALANAALAYVASDDELGRVVATDVVDLPGSVEPESPGDPLPVRHRVWTWAGQKWQNHDYTELTGARIFTLAMFRGTVFLGGQGTNLRPRVWAIPEHDLDSDNLRGWDLPWSSFGPSGYVRAISHIGTTDVAAVQVPPAIESRTAIWTTEQADWPSAQEVELPGLNTEKENTPVGSYRWENGLGILVQRLESFAWLTTTDGKTWSKLEVPLPSALDDTATEPQPWSADKAISVFDLRGEQMQLLLPLQTSGTAQITRFDPRLEDGRPIDATFAGLVQGTPIVCGTFSNIETQSRLSSGCGIGSR